MASTYCKVLFNWRTETDENVTQERATNVIRYTFVDIGSSDFDNISFENRVNAQDAISLQFQKQVNDESFEATISCNNPEFSQIDGLSIDSESRTLEISSGQEGYIKTVRGRKLIRDSDDSDVKTSTDTSHFVCTCSFDRPYSSLSIKLLSLGKKDSVCIRSITINIRQHHLDHTASSANGTFDMSKLKKDIEGMGDSVSDRALDFLATMETFEKNKMSSLGGLFGQNALLTMQSPAGQNGISSIMRSVLGDDIVKNLEEDVSSKACEGASTEQDSIYSMLQAVCGKVAASRTQKKSVSREDPSSDAIQDSDHPVSSNKKPINGQVQGVNGSNVMLGVLNQKLEEAKQDMRQEMQAVKNEVMTHIDDVKREVMGKLDTIALMLQGLQASGSGHSLCVQDE